MDEKGRTYKLIRNTIYGLGGQIFTYIITFVYRTVFIYTLGQTYLGVQGLFSNILSILSLADLGVGSAITFSLYKPLAESDVGKINRLMNFYSRTYKLIGCMVAIVGILLIPFLDSFIAYRPNVKYLTIIYLLFLSESVISYFFSYKRSIIIADQKSYINTLNVNIFSLFRNTCQIIWLVLFKSFIPVLIIQITFTFLSNITISHRVDKLYPYLSEVKRYKLEKLEQKELFKKIGAMMSHRIGSVVVLSTDNLLISKYVGIDSVGIYSNYLMIINMINSVISQFTQAVVSSIGNLIASEDLDTSREVFHTISFFMYWIFSFCTICLLILLNPFISIWIGKEYTFSIDVVIIIVINFYIAGLRQIVLSYRNALGLFWNDRYKPIIEAIINLIVSIYLLKSMGIRGVFIGTLISTITTSLWLEPYVLYKNYFKVGLIKYYITYIVRSIIVVIIGSIMHFIAKVIFNGTILSFLILMIICAIIPNLLMTCIYFKTQDFRNLYHRIRNILKF